MIEQVSETIHDIPQTLDQAMQDSRSVMITQPKTVALLHHNHNCQ
jgi:hypothetical protein